MPAFVLHLDKLYIDRRFMAHSHRALALASVLLFQWDICSVWIYSHRALALAATLMLQSEWGLYPF